MKRLLEEVARTMAATELAEAADVAKKWAKKPLTPMKPKMKDPVRVHGVGVMEKDQAERLFPGLEHTSTKLHKEEVELDEETNSAEKKRLQAQLKAEKDPHRQEYLKLELRKLQGEVELRAQMKEELDVPTLKPDAIAKLHGVSLDAITTQLVKGIKVEMEHTTDKDIAREIALDHLKEDPKYYDKLAKVEEGFFGKGGTYDKATDTAAVWIAKKLTGETDIRAGESAKERYARQAKQERDEDAERLARKIKEYQRKKTK